MSRFDRLLLGVAFLILTVMMVWATEGDVTIAVLTIPIAMYCIFGKDSIERDLDRLDFIDKTWDEYREGIDISREPQLFDLREEE